MKRNSDELNDKTKAVLKGAVLAGAFVGGTYATAHTAYADELTKVSKLDNQASTLLDHKINLSSENHLAEQQKLDSDKFNESASNSKSINLSMSTSNSVSVATSKSTSVEQSKSDSLTNKKGSQTARNSGLVTPPHFGKRYQYQ